MAADLTDVYDLAWGGSWSIETCEEELGDEWNKVVDRISLIDAENLVLTKMVPYTKKWVKEVKDHIQFVGAVAVAIVSKCDQLSAALASPKSEFKRISRLLACWWRVSQINWIEVLWHKWYHRLITKRVWRRWLQNLRQYPTRLWHQLHPAGLWWKTWLKNSFSLRRPLLLMWKMTAGADLCMEENRNPFGTSSDTQEISRGCGTVIQTCSTS